MQTQGQKLTTQTTHGNKDPQIYLIEAEHNHTQANQMNKEKRRIPHKGQKKTWKNKHKQTL